jgi:hypothetical protein
VSEQEDFFGPAQLGLGLEDTRPDPAQIDPQEVREELTAILAAARAAHDTAPWDLRTHRYHKTVFPQMACWLPDNERDQLCFEFSREMGRIELLLAA